MTRLGEALKRLVDALMRVEDRKPKVVEDAIERDGLTPEELEEWRRRGGGVAPPDAPHIDEGGI